MRGGDGAANHSFVSDRMKLVQPPAQTQSRTPSAASRPMSGLLAEEMNRFSFGNRAASTGADVREAGPGGDSPPLPLHPAAGPARGRGGGTGVRGGRERDATDSTS